MAAERPATVSRIHGMVVVLRLRLDDAQRGAGPLEAALRARVAGGGRRQVAPGRTRLRLEAGLATIADLEAVIAVRIRDFELSWYD
jgi:hypothetical protein